MRNLQHLFALLTLTLLMPFLTKASTESELIVRLSSGDSLTSLLSTQPVVYFTNSQLLVKETTTNVLRIDELISAVKQITISPTFVHSGSGQSGSSSNVLPVCLPVDYHVNYGLTGENIPFEEPVEPVSISSATINIEYSSYPYTGSAIEPSISVIYNGTTLIKGTDYQLSFLNNT